MKYKAVVIGCSAGGLQALEKIIPSLPKNFPLAVIVVQHMKPSSRDNFLAEHLDEVSEIDVKEAVCCGQVSANTVHIGPPGYHLLIEEDFTFSLCSGPRVNYSIPSIDVLFESAAFAYGKSLIGIILTGANSDGSKGLKEVKEAGGLAIVQHPDTAEAQPMPLSAIESTETDFILPLEKIVELLINLSKTE